MFGVTDLTGKLLFAVIVAALGSGFQHGYNTGVVNVPQDNITDWIIEQMGGSVPKNEANMTAEETSFKNRATFIYATIVSIFCLGGMVGGFITNIWSNIFGRKYGIVANNIFVLISGFLMGFSKQAHSYPMLIVGRFVVGINCGLNAGLVPMYLSEIPPVHLRGGVGSLYQFFLTVSILISQIMGEYATDWSFLFYFIIIPGIMQAILLPFCADSPQYLQKRQAEEAARKALVWLRGTDDVQAEFDMIKSEAQEHAAAGNVTLGNFFTDPMLRTPLLISCTIMLAQQFSGINAVIFYSTSTFEKANLGDVAATGTLIMGAMNVVMTAISVLIVDNAGRKTLLSIGFGTMFIDTILLCVCLVFAFNYENTTAAYASIVLVTMFVVFFAIGPGSIPWFLVAELFLQNARQQAASIAVAVNWIGNYIVSLTFPSLQEFMGPYVFIIFAAFQFIFLIYILLKVPETKNRTIEDITSEFKPKET